MMLLNGHNLRIVPPRLHPGRCILIRGEHAGATKAFLRFAQYLRDLAGGNFDQEGIQPRLTAIHDQQHPSLPAG